MNHSVEFFDKQFRRQVREGEYALNPFENRALPYLHGAVLDLGCGLGNLAIEAARRGCSVLSLDASAAAIRRIQAAAADLNLPILARKTDLDTYRFAEDFDVIVSIGLLMFMQKLRARNILNDIKQHVRPGGCAIVNVLVEGTTYMDMFEESHFYLFGATELQDAFREWEILESITDEFEAPGETVKKFATIIARKPSLAPSA
jgi:tellurite methyltransferase